jgi:hypothetical protein
LRRFHGLKQVAESGYQHGHIYTSSHAEDMGDAVGKTDQEKDKSFLVTLRSRRTPPWEIRVGKLSGDEKRDIVNSYLRQYNKK